MRPAAKVSSRVTRDEEIAWLRERIEFLERQISLLNRMRDRKQPPESQVRREGSPLSAAERARRYRQKHPNLRRRPAGYPDGWRGRVLLWGERCWICFDPWEEIDHVIPFSRGGAHLPANLRPICKHCNRQKHDDPTYAKLQPWGRDERLTKSQKQAIADRARLRRKRAT